jgi:Cyclophilin type peptidyl-prolyl cis-trans isomerase/CLD
VIWLAQNRQVFVCSIFQVTKKYGPFLAPRLLWTPGFLEGWLCDSQVRCFQRGPVTRFGSVEQGRATLDMKVTLKTPRDNGVTGGVMRIVVDGYNAPVTAGNFVDLVTRKFYDGMEVQRSDGFVVQTGDPDGPVRRWIDRQTDGRPRRPSALVDRQTDRRATPTAQCVGGQLQVDP